MKPDKTTHGGPRPRAGRPNLYDEKMVVVTIRLPPRHREAIRALGDGNVALGVRRLLEAHQEANPKGV